MSATYKTKPTAGQALSQRLIPNYQNYHPLGISSPSPSQIPYPQRPATPTRESGIKPLLAFDTELFERFYGHSLDGGNAKSQCAPCKPDNFDGVFLEPTLTHNEFRRLTMLWYHTRHINEDEELLAKLRSMNDMVQQITGWEYAVIGIVDADVFVRLATKNLPVAVIPRRDTPSAHTLVQTEDVVFQVPRASEDWRFRSSPWADVGGMESYAGAQLKLRLDDGENLALGTVCIASAHSRDALTPEQQKTLLHASELVMTEIVASTRLRRLNVRDMMSTTLSSLRVAGSGHDIEGLTLDTIQQLYPGELVTIESVEEEAVVLNNGYKIALSEVQSGLWEDTAYIQEILRNADGLYTLSSRPIRAIFGHVPRSNKCLVLITTDLRFVFDDLDAWFIDQCAQNIRSVVQEKTLKDALATKNRFLRGITHQLRTPIHGVLTSAELLSEELKVRGLLNQSQAASKSGDEALSAYLKLIRQSGIELMNTVNNMLRLNAWTNDSSTSVQTVYDLLSLEQDILDGVLGNFSESALQGLSIRFENNFPKTASSISIDADLLKDLLKCLVQNAIQATKDGIILVRTNLDVRTGVLVFDVIDTGTGISETDRHRIFQPFEKVDTHTTGAGLGLALSSQIASTLGGNVSLVSSTQGADSGSHFRAVLTRFTMSPKTTSPKRRTTRNNNIPNTFCILTNSDKNIDMLEHIEQYLVSRKMQRSDQIEGSIIIMNQPGPLSEYPKSLQGLSHPHVIIAVSGSAAHANFKPCIEEGLQDHLCWPVAGPLHTTRLDGIFTDLDHAFGSHLRKRTSSRSSIDVSQAGTLASTVQRLSISTPSAPAAAQTSSPTICPPINTIPIHALLVDDNSVNLRVLQMYCKKRSIPYINAADGNEAVWQYNEAVRRSMSVTTTSSSITTAHISSTACPETNPDTSRLERPPAPTQTSISLTLMDLQMPNCDGILACQRIRAVEAEQGLPRSVIFMVTGQDSVADRKSSFEAGADEYMVKPVSLKKLDWAIAQYFPAYEASRLDATAG